LFIYFQLYGEDSQNINVHNLIHLADDVEYTNVEISSVFIFELPWIKNTIRRRKKLLHQLRRVAELHLYLLIADLPQLNHPLSKRISKKRSNRGAA